MLFWLLYSIFMLLLYYLTLLSCLLFSFCNISFCFVYRKTLFIYGFITLYTLVVVKKCTAIIHGYVLRLVTTTTLFFFQCSIL